MTRIPVSIFCSSANIILSKSKSERIPMFTRMAFTNTLQKHSILERNQT